MKVLTERLTQRDIERWTGVESAQKKATSSGRKASRKAASSSKPGTKKVSKRQQRSFEEQECKLFFIVERMHLVVSFGLVCLLASLHDKVMVQMLQYA